MFPEPMPIKRTISLIPNDLQRYRYCAVPNPSKCGSCSFSDDDGITTFKYLWNVYHIIINNLCR